MKRTDPSALTERESAVAQAYAGGADSREVGEALGIAQSTVRTHLLKVYGKLGVRNKVGLVRALGGDTPAPCSQPAEERLARLAVLRPFDPTAGDAGLQLIGAAAQAVTSALSVYPDVRVALSMPGRRLAPGADLGGVARELRVEFLVVPSVSAVVEGADLMLQLVDRRGAAVWTLGCAVPMPCPRDLVREAAGRFATQVAGMRGEIVRLARQRPGHEVGAVAGADPYGLYLAAGDHLERAGEGRAEAAVALAERAVALDPSFSRGWLMLGWSRHFRASAGVAPYDTPERETAIFRCATDIAPRDGLGFAYLALGRAKQGAQAEARRLIDHAIELANGSADVTVDATLGLVTIAGQPQRALCLIDDALARCPCPAPAWRYMEARAAWFSGLPERALAATDHGPDWIPNLLMRALAAAELGDAAETVRSWGRLRAVAPGFDLAGYARELPITHPAALERYLAGARRLAGVVARAGASGPQGG